MTRTLSRRRAINPTTVESHARAPLLALFAALACCLLANDARAQNDLAGALAEELNNPISSVAQVPFQNNFDYGGGSEDDGHRYIMNIQPLTPMTLNADWNLIVRTVIPIADFERVFPDDESGLGDIAQSFFFSPKQPTTSGATWGFGPVFLYPTATNDLLGREQWGMGPTAVVFQPIGRWFTALLANHIWSVSDVPDDRTRTVAAGPIPPLVATFPQQRTNITFVQPVVGYTFASQTTLFLSSESTYDWSADQAVVPIQLGLTQLVNVGGQAMQLGGLVRRYVETPEGGPEWGFQLRATLVFPR